MDKEIEYEDINRYILTNNSVIELVAIIKMAAMQIKKTIKDQQMEKDISERD